MAAEKRYKSEASLRRACRAYIDSISRTVTAREEYDSGERDELGHVVYAYRDILADSGEPIRYREFIRPPGVGGLSAFLRIHRSTWANYCDPIKHPEFTGICAEMRDVFRTWREEELLTRKNVRGLMFDLQNNYGLSEKHTMSFDRETISAMKRGPATIAEKMALISELRAELLDPVRAEGGDACPDEPGDTEEREDEAEDEDGEITPPVTCG